MQFLSVLEYLMGRIKVEDLTPEQTANVNTLIPKVNQLLEKFGKYRKITSGFRSIEDQRRINPKSMKSAHLSCEAVDLSDADGELNKWMKKHPKLLEELDLYCEERQGRWQHIQIRKVPSGNRWFNP